MKDRVSTKILNNGATRYGVYDETGALLRYEYIKLEDKPSTEGDFFNKANMLPDSIPALLGLKMANPQVKDALNVLAHVGNLHVWERVKTYADPVPEVPAGYTLGETLNKVVLYTNYNSDDVSRSITCYESLTVEKDGAISGANSSRHTIYYSRSNSTLPSSIGGKFLYENSGSTAHTNAKYTDQWWYIPTDVEILTGTGDTSDGESSNRWMGYSKLQKVTGYPYTPAIPAGTTTDYLTSTDRNAYPDQSAEGGEPEIPAHYTLADAVTVDVLSSAADYSARVYVCDLNSIIINNNGSISTTSFSTLMSGSNSLTMAGNWTKFSTTKAYYITSNSSNVVFTDTIFTVSAETTLQYADGKYVLPGCRELIGHAKVEAIPPNTSITYLGQLGGGTRIEVGSYVGTGAYGSNNKNTLTFKNKRPKKVTVVPKTHSDNSQIVSGSFPFVNGATSAVARLYLGSYSSRNVNLSWSDNSVSWYSTETADVQLNKKSDTYFYVAEF